MGHTRRGWFGRAITGRRRALRSWILPASAAAILAGTVFSATALAGSGPAQLPPDWHIHDGQPALGAQHKGTGFFPAILGISLGDYANDPARCPNATDKAFLPSNGTRESDLLRAGMCMTSTVIIHLRTVPLGTSGPDGWLSRTAATEPGWITYYLVTPK